MAATAVGTKLIFAGGTGPSGFSATVDIYDTASQTWSTASLSVPRSLMCATTVGSKAFFAGGYSDMPSGPSAVVDVYDDATGQWSVLELSEPRFGCGAAGVAGLALIAGGGIFDGGPVTYDLVDVLPAEPVLVPYCFGDGSGAACPCGNAGGADQGCANSTGAGARLAATGWVSVGADDLGFDAAGLVAGEAALLFVGQDALAGGDGVAFGDGLRCAGTQAVRLGVELAGPGGDAGFGPGLAAQGGWSAGDTRAFQVWYRDPVGGPCSSGFNLTPGVEARFFP